MTKIKVCGLTRKVDIEWVNELNPDYIGFVFAESRRKIEAEKAAELISSLYEGIKTVGVFVNESADKVRRIAQLLKLDVLQFHGNETEEYMRQFSGFEVWKAVAISSKEDLKRLNLYNTDIVNKLLLDSSYKGKSGGTGICFDWEILKNFKLAKPLFLAGGLNEENIEEAIKIVKPYGIDVSSGVEVDGFKDFYKMKALIKRVRELD